MNFSKLVSVHRFVAAVLLAFGLLQATANADVAANVHFVSGLVNGQQPGQAQRALAKGDNIFSRDHIETSANGRIQMRFTDGGLVSLMPNTSFSVEEYQLDAASEEDSSLVFSMVRGGLRTVTGSIGRTHHENYQLRTPVGTLGIRGTEYIAVLEPPTVLHVHVGVGRVVLGNEHGSLEVPAGRSARMAVDSAPVFTEDAPRFLANAPITADWVQGYDIGSVTQDPYVVMVSYDLPIAGARHLARQIGELPPPGDAPVQPPVSEPQPVPEPEPEPEPIPEPEPGPEPEPEPIEPPLPEPEPGDDDELEPTPVPVPTPPVTPPPPLPSSYTSNLYGGILLGDAFPRGQAMEFAADGKLLSISGDPINVIDDRYGHNSRIESGRDVPDVAIGEYDAGLSEITYYVVGMNDGFTFPENVQMSYALPSSDMHVGRFSDGTEAILERFELVLSSPNARLDYELDTRVRNSQTHEAYEIKHHGSYSDGILDRFVFWFDEYNNPGSFVKKSSADDPGAACGGCSMELNGLFGENGAHTGVYYSLAENSDSKVSGAAILEMNASDAFVFGNMAGVQAPTGPLLEPQFSAAQPVKIRAADGVLLDYDTANQYSVKSSASLDWTRGIGIALDHNGLPFAFGSDTVTPVLSGTLVFSLMHDAAVGRDLRHFELTLKNLDGSTPVFDFAMEVEEYIVNQTDGILLDAVFESPYNPSSQGFGMRVNSDSGGTIQNLGSTECDSCSLRAVGVFSDDASYTGIVYELDDPNDTQIIQGAAILQRN